MSDKIEKQVIKEIRAALKQAKKSSEEDNYALKNKVLSLMGFDMEAGNKSNPIEDKKFIQKEMPIIIEELLTGSHVDLSMLEKVVKVQNGVYDMPLSPLMKECLEEGLLSKKNKISEFENIKKLKFHQENGNIEEDVELSEHLNRNSPVFNNAPISDLDRMNFENQRTVNAPMSAGVSSSEKPDTPNANKTPTLDVNSISEAMIKYQEKARAMNAIERRYYKDNTEFDKTSKIPILKQMYSGLNKAKKWLYNPIESQSLVQMDASGVFPLQPLFKMPLFGKGVRFDGFPDPKQAAQVYELAALKCLSDGIDSPYVFTKKPQNVQEQMDATAFITGQVKALLNEGYDIDNITVSPHMNHVMDGIRKNELQKRKLISNTSDFIPQATNATLTSENKMILLDTITYDEDNFKDLARPKEELNLIKKIENDKPLSDEEVLLLTEKMKQAAEARVENTDVEPTHEEENKEKVSKEDDELESTFNKDVLVEGEQNLLSNMKKLRDFSDFSDSEGNPEMIEGQKYKNPVVEDIKNLEKKIENPVIRKELSQEQIDLIQRKSALIDVNTLSNSRDAKLLTAVLNSRNSLSDAWDSLEPQNMNAINDLIMNEGFGKLHDYLSNYNLSGLCKRPETDFPVIEENHDVQPSVQPEHQQESPDFDHNSIQSEHIGIDVTQMDMDGLLPNHPDDITQSQYDATQSQYDATQSQYEDLMASQDGGEMPKNIAADKENNGLSEQSNIDSNEPVKPKQRQKRRSTISPSMKK